MAWRTVMIQNPAKLHLAKGQLKLENDTGEVTLPIEDITAIILESPQISLSSTLLSHCQEHGVAVLTCDNTHMPNGLLLPFLPHSRQSQVAHVQQSWSEPLRKRLWQTVVKQKIQNQARCLEMTGNADSAKRLFAMTKHVQSGDPENMEAQAARIYWPALLGSSFRRGAGDAVNGALNYGYAVVRAFVARSQVAYGLLPTFGIHHNNKLNAFNLTDDVMEVFRPFIDVQVWEMQQENAFADSDTLSQTARQQLANAGGLVCRINDQSHTLVNSCEQMAAGLVAAIEGKSAALLPLPDLARPPQQKEGA